MSELRQYSAEQTKANITASLPPLPDTPSWQFPKERRGERGSKQTHVSDRQRREQVVPAHSDHVQANSLKGCRNCRISTKMFVEGKGTGTWVQREQGHM